MYALIAVLRQLYSHPWSRTMAVLITVHFGLDNLNSSLWLTSLKQDLVCSNTFSILNMTHAILNSALHWSLILTFSEFEEHPVGKNLVLNLEMKSKDLRDGKLNHQLSTFVENLLSKSNGSELFEKNHANASLVVEGI